MSEDAEPTTQEEANARAAHAERAVRERYAVELPFIAWARSASPPVPLFHRGGPARWHYWWSAHLVEAAVDAARHRPSPKRSRRARAFARGIRLRNGGTWSRPFYDDIAWLGLAFERGGDLLGRGRTRVASRIGRRLAGAIDPAIGAIPWRVGSRLFNAPANGPAAILLARDGERETAARLSDWIEERLRVDPRGLVIDGIEIDGEGERPVQVLYTYCQGVALGANAVLANGETGDRFTDRAISLVEAIAEWTGQTLLLPGSGGGDGGLFAAITCHHLASSASRLEALASATGEEAQDAALRRAAASARRIVVANAEALWAGKGLVDGLPLFSAEAARPADLAPGAAERDLSVQLGAWLTLESAVSATPAP